MLSRSALSLARQFRRAPTSTSASRAVSTPLFVQNVTSRPMTTLEESPSAKNAWEKSCYFEMDFTISDDAPVYEAVQKFAAYDVGCLVTTDSSGKRRISINCLFDLFRKIVDLWAVAFHSGVSWFSFLPGSLNVMDKVFQKRAWNKPKDRGKLRQWKALCSFSVGAVHLMFNF